MALTRLKLGWNGLKSGWLHLQPLTQLQDLGGFCISVYASKVPAALKHLVRRK
jgi:hypothetical protein